MGNIYIATIYVCKYIDYAGLPGYSNVTLGLLGASGNSDIIVRGTCSRFVVGKEYLINIQELA